MIYQLKTGDSNKVWFKKNKKQKFIFSTALLIFVLIFFSHLSGRTANFMSSILSFGNYFYEKTPFVPEFFSKRQSLLNENNKLSEEISNLRLKLLDYETVAEENKRLYLDLGLRPKNNFIGAKIIAKAPQVPTDSIVIDRGEADLIKVGDIVLVGERVMVGVVAEVNKKISTVSLSSFSGNVSYGFIERNKEAVDIEGVGGGGLRARVPIDFDIKQEDKIIIEGNRSYVVAIVASVADDQASGFKDVFLSLPINISQARVVFVENSN